MISSPVEGGGPGRTSLFLGSATGLAASAAWQKDGESGQAWMGYSVASAGDVNKDGYDDVIIGSPYYKNGQTNEGKAYLYLGSAAGITEPPAWAVESDTQFAIFGYSVASAGDINNDGYSDVIIGSPGQFAKVYVYLGSASGLALVPDWTAQGPGGSQFGYSVAGAGDVNGDGFDDIIVGDTYYSNGQNHEGRAVSYVAPGPCANVVCSALDQCHDVGVCNNATGLCSNPNKPDGTACDDANASTVNDVCGAGTCAGSDLCANVVCSALDPCHDAGVCDHATGSCSSPAKANGSACDDADPNTVNDACYNGACGGTNLCVDVVCSALDQCHDAGVCDHATGTCSNPNKANGTACDDGNAQSVNDACYNGACGGMNLCVDVACSALDQCHVAGVCDPATGMCSNPAKADGASCDDNDALTRYIRVFFSCF
jgi:hypothetical protein